MARRDVIPSSPVLTNAVWVLSSLRQLKRQDRQIFLSSSENGGLATERAWGSVDTFVGYIRDYSLTAAIGFLRDSFLTMNKPCTTNQSSTS